MKMLKRMISVILVCALVLSSFVINAGAADDNGLGKTDLTYMNVRDNDKLELYGLYMDKKSSLFPRMDLDVAEDISTGVFEHAKESSGGRIRFKTNSSYVAIKAELPTYISRNTDAAMGDGKYGFDVYVDTEDGSTYIGTIAPDEEDVPTTSQAWSYEGIVDFSTTEERNITIYFPILQEVSNVYVGVQESASVEEHAIPYEEEAPIVYYGSSITQGASATRPGLTYVNTIGRSLNRDYINLGMYGSCKAETAFANYIAGLDMSIFVYDHDHNYNTAEELEKGHEAFFKIVREAHPDIPIIFISRPSKTAQWEAQREVIRKTYNNAIANGDKNVYFIDGQTFFNGNSDYLADTVHPNDKGQAAMAETIGNVLQAIIFPGAYLYTEDFGGSLEDLQDSVGWDDFSNNYDYYDITDGELGWNTDITETRTRILYLDQVSAYGWSDYTVEVDVTVKDAAFYPGKTTGFAGIYVGVPEGVSPSVTDGLECMFFYNSTKANGSYVCMKNRTPQATETYEPKYTSASTAPATTTVTAEAGGTYPVKVEVQNGTVKYYFDGNLCGTWETGCDIVGTIALRMQDWAFKFDNLRVYPTGSEPTQDNYYNIEFYRGERETFINPLKEDDTFDGWYEDADFTTPLGDDVTTGCAYAKWASDSIPVVPDVPDGAYLYTEDFSGSVEDLKTAGWTSGSENKFYYEIVGNELVYDGTANARYLYLDSANAVTWSNYTVEVDVMLTSTPVENFTNVSRWAGITIGAKSGSNNDLKSGYEFALAYRDEEDDTKNKFVTMIRDRKDNSSTNRPDDKNYTTGYNLNQTYTLKVVVDSTKISCYVDNVFQFTWDTGSDVVGTIGLSTQGNICKFDNLRVYETEVGAWYEEDFSGISSLTQFTNEGWIGSVNANTFEVDTENQRLKGINNAKLAWLDVEGVESWTNYTFEADVTITTERISGAGTYACIRVGKTENSEGYELMLNRQYTTSTVTNMTLSNTYVALKNRANTNGVSTPQKNYGAEDGAIQAEPTVYNLKMEINGEIISCYLNDEKVFDVTVPGGVYGSIGLYSGGACATFDNLRLYPTTQKDNNYYDVAFYRAGRNNVIPPFKEDVVFGGWYADATFKTPLAANVKTGKAYAKWVDEDVLTVKAQLDANTTTNSAKTSMRFVTTVDESLDYDKVGFIINGAKYGETTTVYRTLLAREGLNVVKCSLSDFSTDSAYFVAVTLENIPLFKDLDGNGVLDEGETDNRDTAIVVTPYWVTADGTTVSGTTRNDITINLGLARLAQPYGL